MSVTTTDEVLLVILTSLLCLYFLLGIVLTLILIKTASSVKRVVAKAEGIVDSAENAAEIFVDTKGRLALFKLIRNIYKSVNKRKK